MVLRLLLALVTGLSPIVSAAAPRIPTVPQGVEALAAPVRPQAVLPVVPMAESTVGAGLAPAEAIVNPALGAIPEASAGPQNEALAPEAIAKPEQRPTIEAAKDIAVSIADGGAEGTSKQVFDAQLGAGQTSDVAGSASVPGALDAATTEPRAAAAEPPPSAAFNDVPFIFKYYRVLRPVARVLLSVLYSIRLSGDAALPPGPVIITPNHVTYADPVIIGVAVGRPLRFMMKRAIYERMPRFFNALGAIPVSPKDSREKIEESLERARNALRQGQSLAIFPEGQLTLNGNMVGFRTGFARINDGVGVPVIPAYVDGMWGSVFSMQKGPSLWDRVKKTPRPVSVRFGTPLSDVTPQSCRLAVAELGAQAFSDRIETQRAPLAREAFRSGMKNFFKPALADTTGAADLNFGKALTGSILMGRALEPLVSGEKNVGVLMPPTIGGNLANVGLAMQGRVPINLNYTASLDAVAHGVAQADIKTVVTSRKFLAKLKETKGFVLPEGLKIIYLEDLAPTIPAWKKTALYLALLLLPASLAERLFLKNAGTELDETATVLFTSGSSAMPKGVVLTQKNILANVEMVRDVLPHAKRDTVLGVLPFFHSFGYTVTLWLPWLSGMAAAYHTHPTETDKIEELALRTKPTILLGTPAFFEKYSQRIKREAFASVRLAIAGAEKLRDSVADGFEKAFGIRPYEGYGATELSPVATAGVPDEKSSEKIVKGTKPGSVGRALPGVVIKAIDEVTGQIVPDGQEGMLLAKGANVMAGYLGQADKTKEVLKDGWYVTGDKGSVDRDGFVSISGRASRFSKIMGEMVSHVAVEEKMQEAAGLSDMTFVVTGGKGEKGEFLIALYAGWDGDVDALLKKMRASGIPNIWLPNRKNIYRVAEIPLLGTGKLDLKGVNELAAKLAAAPKP